MKFKKEIYQRLKQGDCSDGDYSKSEEIRIVMNNIRQEEFCNVIDYLEEKEINYSCNDISITIGDATLCYDMVMYFKGAKKGYKYGYDKAIKRLTL